ncbi:MAG: adenylate/guanylate cyclase domain-containing protein, partial [Saprospiraceae bacterium]|nr:adenylate/guanylate cyclase domain-containing protein [Saprospiraceae bacterium]
VRIGINTGSVIVGRIGIKGMQKLTTIGDAVNMAARIEQANKELQTRFLISESTKQAAGRDVSISEPRVIRVKGKSGEHRVFEVLQVTD